MSPAWKPLSSITEQDGTGFYRSRKLRPSSFQVLRREDRTSRTRSRKAWKLSSRSKRKSGATKVQHSQPTSVWPGVTWSSCPTTRVPEVFPAGSTVVTVRISRKSSSRWKSLTTWDLSSEPQAAGKTKKNSSGTSTTCYSSGRPSTVPPRNVQHRS